MNFRIRLRNSLKQARVVTIGLIAVCALISCEKPTKAVDPPVAEFSPASSSGTNPVTVYFTNTSTGPFTSSYWSLGDGTTSSATNPSHTYNNPGNYTVTLTVTGEGGSSTRTRSGCVKVTESRSARFTSYDAVWNNTQQIIWIQTAISINGYSGRRFTLGGYWVRKQPDGSYRYVYSGCSSNVPGGYLGHQHNVTAQYDQTTISNLQCAATNFACFKDRTGIYYGFVRLYDSQSIGIDPNSSTLAQSGYVSFQWTSVQGGAPEPVIRVLTLDEVNKLKYEIEAAGGVQQAVEDPQ